MDLDTEMRVDGVSSAKMRDVALRLFEYCSSRDWAGYDPYDALNSRVFKALPLLDVKPIRLALTQGMKRSPLNLRGLLLVPPSQNPKGLGLFLAAVLKLRKLALIRDEELAKQLSARIEALRSPRKDFWCWGYSFPWQTRTRLVPRGEPNLVCTTFVAEALLDMHEEHGDDRHLQMAVSAADYLLTDLFWTEPGANCGFSYPFPSTHSLVHNANLLAGSFLARVYSRTGERKYLECALNVTRCAVRHQATDGSWYYGESATQRWIDNFHTGFNLSALNKTGEYARTNEFEPSLGRGFEFYRTRFFEMDAAPKYFHDRTYPLDVHSVAQSIITLTDLQHVNGESSGLAHSVFRWAVEHLWDERGYFYYQKLPWGKNRICYMRWGQAWMLLALATLLESADANAGYSKTRTVMSGA
jgi:hypothetical protein